MKLFNYYLLNVIAQGLGRVFTFGSNFIVFALIARFFGSEFFGQYSYILNYFGIMVIFADFGLMSVLGKDIAQQKDAPQLYWGNFLMLRLFINILVMFFSILIAYYIRRDLFLLLLMGSFAIPFLASRFFEPVFQVFRRLWYSAYASIIYGLAHLIFAFVAIKSNGKLINFVLAYVTANILYAFIAFYLSKKSVKPLFKIDRIIIKNILKLSMPLGISSIFIIISNRISILMLAWLKSDYAVGIYSAAYKFVEISSFLAAMATAPLIPIFAEKANHGPEAVKYMSSNIFEVMAIILLPFGILCSLISKEIIILIYGIKLLPSAEVFNILIWVCIIIFYSLLISSVVISLGIVRYAYWLGPLSAFLSTILNYILISRFSYTGAAWTALICEVVLAGVTIIYAIKNTGNFLRFKTWMIILILNCLLYVFLVQGIFVFNLYLKMIIGLVLYFLCVFKLRILKKDVYDLLNIKAYFLKTFR